jgi:hypothetical protein
MGAAAAQRKSDEKINEKSNGKDSGFNLQPLREKNV